MSIKILLNGQEYKNWKQASVVRRMEVVCGAFSLTSSADENSSFPIREQDAVKIIVDGNTVLAGYVERVMVKGSGDNHEVTVSGRDILADLVDSSMGALKEFTESISLVGLARKVLDGIGLTSVEVIDDLCESLEPFDAYDIESAGVREKAFDFLERYARKRQVILNSDGEGNLVLARASSDIFPVILKNKKGAVDNNILEISYESKSDERYYEYLVNSELNSIQATKPTTPEQIVSQQGIAYDTEIRTSRRLEIEAEESQNAKWNTDRAKWELNIRRARSLSYSATVQGHSVGDEVWQINKLVKVEDEFANLSTTMLINGVTFNSSVDQGNTTTLKMTHRNAYTLQTEFDAIGL